MTSEKSSVESSAMQVMSTSTPIQGYTTSQSVYFAVPTNPPNGTPENKEKSVYKKPAGGKETLVPDTDVEPSSSVSGVSQIQKSSFGASQEKSTALVAGCTKTTHTTLANSAAPPTHTQSKLVPATLTNTSYFALPNQAKSTMSAVQTMNSVPAKSNANKITTVAPLVSGSTAPAAPPSKTSPYVVLNDANAKTAIPTSTVPTPVPMAPSIQPHKPVTLVPLVPVTSMANKPHSSVIPAAGGSTSNINKVASGIQYTPVKTTQYTITYAKPAQAHTDTPVKAEGGSSAPGSQYQGSVPKPAGGYHSDYVSSEARNAAVISCYITSVQPTPITPNRAKTPAVPAIPTTPKPAGASNYQEIKPTGGTGNSNYQEIKPSGGIGKPTGGTGNSNYQEIKPTGGSGNSNYQELKPSGGTGGSNYEELKGLPSKAGKPAADAKTDAKFYENLTSYESLLRKQEENK